MIKTSVLILSSKTYPSVKNSKIQKKLFLKTRNEEIFWYKQGTNKQLKNKKTNLILNDLYVPSSDDSLSMGYKTLDAFEWMLINSEFEYLFRTNTSSYFSLQNLNEFISKNLTNSEFVYSGLIQETKDFENNLVVFASGSGYILNRKTVQLIVANKELWNHDYWDDVSLALMLKKFNILPQIGKRFDIMGNPYRQNIDVSNYHFRCRIDNHYGYPRVLETQVLKFLDKKINNIEESKLKKSILDVIFELFKLLYVHQFAWKLFLIAKSFLKKFLPKTLYNFFKKIFKKQITKFKLVRFKT